MEQRVQAIFEESIHLHQFCRDRFGALLAETAAAINTRLKAGGRILIMGNGGSAADAIHWTAELVGRFQKERRGLPAIALCDNPSILTAVANDYGYDQVFARQAEALARNGDVLLAISTSGNSPNILRALEVVRPLDILTAGFTGENGGAMRDRVQFLFAVPSRQIPRIQEIHALLGHTLCELIESAW